MALTLNQFPTSLSDTSTGTTISWTSTVYTSSSYYILVYLIIDGVTIASASATAATSGTVTLPISSVISNYYSALQGKPFSGTSYANVATTFRIRVTNNNGTVLETRADYTQNITYNINYRVGSYNRLSPTTANPLNLDSATPGNIQYSWSNARNTYFRVILELDVWNGSSWVNTFDSIGLTRDDGTTFGVHTVSGWATSMATAMNNVSPRNLRISLRTQYRRASGTWINVGSSTVQEVSNGVVKQFQTFPDFNIGSSQYTFPNSGWTTSYFYLRASSSIKSNGLYDVDVEVYLRAGASMNSTVNGASCTINGAPAGIKSGFASPVVLANTNTMLFGTFTITNIGPFTTRSPQFTLEVTLNLSQAGTRTTGTITSAVGIMPVIPALASNHIVAHTISNGDITNASIRNNQYSSGGITGNDFSFYKIRIAESTNNINFSNSRDSSFGEGSYATTWESRSAYIVYYYRLEIVGRDNSSYGNTVVQLRANDNPPTLSTFTVGPVSTSSIITNVSASSISAVTYNYYRKLNSSGTWSDLGNTSTNSYGHTGLASNTRYDFKVRVTNADGLWVESGAAGQVANLTNISTLANIPTISSFTRTARTDTAITMAVSATVDSGLTATYSYGIRQGTAAFVFGSYSASTSFVYGGLTPGASYDMKVRVKDSLGSEVESSTATHTTLFSAPSISTTNILNITATSATIKISLATNQAGISAYRFKVYPQGDTEPVEWNSRTVDNYSVFGLSSNQEYVVKSQVLDTQGLISSVVTTNFTTLSVAPITSNVRARLVRTLSTTLPAVRDGNFIVATDTGDIFIDTNIGRRIVSYGLKAYGATVTGANLSITTTNFNNLDYGVGGTTLTFYIIPNANVNSASATLTIIRPGDSNLQNIVLERADSTTVTMTSGKPYLVSFANNKFYLVNDR